MKNEMLKRILAVLVVVCMLISAIPTTVFAEDTVAPDDTTQGDTEGLIYSNYLVD